MIWIMNLAEVERALEPSKLSLQRRPTAALSVELVSSRTAPGSHDKRPASSRRSAWGGEPAEP